MQNVLDLNDSEAQDFFLKHTSYANFNMPIYFDFSQMLYGLKMKLGNRELSNFYENGRKPREYEDVNYMFLHNKEGRHDRRPLQIIHPAIYVRLVTLITQPENWKFIQERLQEFKEKSVVRCYSLPVVSETDESDRAQQVHNRWEKIEQASIELGLDYDYLYHTDITDCYGSIYTHSIAWALH